MSYLDPLIEAYREKADSELAEKQEAYMKGLFEYYGMKMPDRRVIDKAFLSIHPKPTADNIEDLVMEAYSHPQREIHYFVLDQIIRLKKRLQASHLALAKYMITTHSWWDTVDAIASHVVGQLVLSNPELKKEVEDWIYDENMWLRRTAIIYQLKYKQATDEASLFRLCELELGSKEFFIRKAIGWALREHAKLNPEAVIGFVEQHPELSGLSRREALKHIKK